MYAIVTADHQRDARRLKQLTSRYNRNIDLINVGAYSAGSDPILDEAIRKRQAVESFLQQDRTERSDVPTSINRLATLFSDAGSSATAGR